MILTLRLLAPETSPERLPSEFMPTRTIDRPIPSAPLVVNRLSQLKLPPPRAVLSPNPWMVCLVLSSCTVTPLGAVPPEPVEAPPAPPVLAVAPALPPRPDEPLPAAPPRPPAPAEPPEPIVPPLAGVPPAPVACPPDPVVAGPAPPLPVVAPPGVPPEAPPLAVLPPVADVEPPEAWLPPEPVPWPVPLELQLAITSALAKTIVPNLLLPTRPPVETWSEFGATPVNSRDRACRSRPGTPFNEADYRRAQTQRQRLFSRSHDRRRRFATSEQFATSAHRR